MKSIMLCPGSSFLFAGQRENDSCRQRAIPVTIVLNCQGTYIMKIILVQKGVSPLKDCLQVGVYTNCRDSSTKIG